VLRSVSSNLSNNKKIVSTKQFKNGTKKLASVKSELNEHFGKDIINYDEIRGYIIELLTKT